MKDWNRKQNENKSVLDKTVATKPSCVICGRKVALNQGICLRCYFGKK